MMNNLKKQLCLLLTTTLLAMLVMTTAAFAASQPTFTTKAAHEGSNIVLEVNGEQLTDVYAYEFQVAYDQEKLKFIRATSTQEGFTANPIVKDGRVLFAHTNTGQDEGIEGKTTLATFTFEKLQPGEVSFTISSFKLVNSSLELSSVTTRLKVIIGDLYTDISGHWAEAAILKASQFGWVSGYTDETFRPESNITRGEFVTMLVRVLDLKIDTSAELNFKDAKAIPSWSKAAIATAVKAGLVNGYSDGTFQANKFVTRAEMAAIIVRSQSVVVNYVPIVTFDDAGDIPTWAKPYVAAAVDKGWIRGTGNNTFAPMKKATRAEATQMLINLDVK